ncbi:hypothetical protein COT72_05610 [archaeon CG10_big_fil_rev_8_21_14_0_10_43_11]|nr:MAG: hypothetical protein COT72_05610 [archaeon CG10_big_fil_rev_8_21_14_0_10_43_11]
MGIISTLKKIIFPNTTSLMDMLINHSKISVRAVEQLDTCVQAFCDQTLVVQDVQKIDALEDEGDAISYKLSQELFKGALLPYTSQDWVELVELVDTIADDSERAGKLLIVHKVKTPTHVSGQLLALVRLGKECAQLLSRAIEQLNIDMTKTEDVIEQIRFKRHEARRVEYALFSDLFDAKQLPEKDVLFLKEIAYWLAQISNTSKKAANRIAMMAVKYSF